ncbi:hypothetical protein DQ04_09151010 [Trypanosoma grayi]|uniref:hypothetical protein n=1 Tax=Trypanosoma grayi TaxID=71804 RepID=UPI0004F48743|nr:hypothetical protein DQ04_09151010 [Trypanosoma grayi]KEG07664.1 hypothetical protein DQ04_09151010 [Trypanosoma grayi]
MVLARGCMHASMCVWRRAPSLSDAAATHVIAILCVRRTLNHRSLSPDDPFGERSASSDPSEGFYSSWSGVDLDAFANAAASEEVRTAHFGPDWSKFTTVGRLSVKKMKEQGTLGAANDAAGVTPGSSHGSDRGTMPQPLTREELHARELQARKKSLEKNYSSYEEYVVKELGIVGDDGDNEAADTCVSKQEVGMVDKEEEGEDDEETVPLPQFMATLEVQRNASSDTVPGSETGTLLARRRETLQVPDPLMSAVLSALGEPHGNPQLPRTDPLHWNTEEILLWVTKMEQVRHSLVSAAAVAAVAVDHGGSGENEDAADEAPVMQDPSMQEAFHMAGTNGEYLLHHTVPNTLFQVMRRWYLRRQEIALLVMTEHQKNHKSGVNSCGGGGGGWVPDDAFVRTAVENGRAKLDEAAAKVTPTLIRETICQCYPYCR